MRRKCALSAWMWVCSFIWTVSAGGADGFAGEGEVRARPRGQFEWMPVAGGGETPQASCDILLSLVEQYFNCGVAGGVATLRALRNPGAVALASVAVRPAVISNREALRLSHRVVSEGRES